jgi:tRNA modification GTPase
MQKEPIVAIATPYGESAIGVVRLSGKGVLDIVKNHFRTKSDIKHRFAHFGTLLDKDGEELDEGILIYFRAPKSYTGEDMVELYLHGNPLILRKALELFLVSGCRLAEPGEFTKRAFLNGKIDLTQAEAVAELISAKSELARKAALRQLRGELSKRVSRIRENLLELAAYIEADIEFSEEDIPTLSKQQVIELVERSIASIDSLLETARTGKYIREGIRLAIVGKPNVGKSSLFNALLRRDRAIVTEIAGTTRDFLEEQLNLCGIPILLVDTAGIRKSGDRIEMIGIERSKQKMEEADLILFVIDASKPLEEADLSIYEELKDKRHIVVANKVDLGYKVDVENFEGNSIIKVSALEKSGIDELEKEILSKIGINLNEEVGTYISLRHEVNLKKSKEVLSSFLERYSKEDMSPEIAMLDIREAISYLEEIVGGITTEDILGSIFSRFCIGK